MKNATSTVATLGPVGRADVKWWLETLPKWPRRSYLRPAQETAINTTNVVTNACRTGLSAVMGTKWFASAWPSEWLDLGQGGKDLFMPFMELAAVVVAIRTWVREIEGMWKLQPSHILQRRA